MQSSREEKGEIRRPSQMSNAREIEENNRKTRDLFKKIGDIKGTFRVSTGMIKDRKLTT